MKQNNSYYVGYNKKNKEIGIFDSMVEFRVVRDSYPKEGRISRYEVDNRKQAVELTNRFILSNTNINPEFLKCVSIKNNELISIDELLTTTPPFYINI